MDNKITNIKERILHIIEYHNDTRENFFQKIGMTYGNFKGSQRNRPLNSDAVANILSIYTDIEPEWLITGTGEMLKHTPHIKMNDIPTEHSTSCNNCKDKDERISELQYTVSVQRELIERLKSRRDMGAENASVADVG